MRKYVINTEYGGFWLPEEYTNLPDCPAQYQSESNEDIREDPRLIAIIEAPGYDGDLSVVGVPDDATDTYLIDYDGMETLLYVQNGIIYEA